MERERQEISEQNTVVWWLLKRSALHVCALLSVQSMK